MTISLAQQAKNVASAGRYGDSVMLHLHPDELRGIASVMPLTINPETGHAEAFLPLLLGAALPALGGAGALGAGGAALAGTTLGAAALGAGGSLAGGAIQGAVTGDMEAGMQEGMMGAITGGAMGGAMAGLGGAALGNAASQAATAGTAGAAGSAAAGAGAGAGAGGAAGAGAGGAGALPTTTGAFGGGAGVPQSAISNSMGGVGGMPGMPSSAVGGPPPVMNPNMSAGMARAPGGPGGGAPRMGVNSAGSNIAPRPGVPSQVGPHPGMRGGPPPGLNPNAGAAGPVRGAMSASVPPPGAGGPVAGAPPEAGGIGSLVKNNAGLIAAGAPMLMSMMGGSEGEGAPKRKKSGPRTDRKRSSREYTDQAPNDDGSENKYFGRRTTQPYNQGGLVGYAEGGIASMMAPASGGDDPVVGHAVMAIRGEHPQPKQAIGNFISKYGPEAFERLMAKVMQPRSDGLSDSIPASNPDGRQAALSEGEYVVPADVVSHMGNGSTNAGGAAFDDIVAKARAARTGNPGSPAQIDPRGIASL